MHMVRHADDDHLSEVIPGVYISGLGPSRDGKSLKKNKIKTIVCCSDSLKPCFPDHFKYVVVPVKDSPEVDIVAASREAVAAVATSVSNGERILVHCHCGISRSVSVVILYLIQHRGMSFLDALTLVKAGRPQADPNVGFRAQLLQLTPRKVLLEGNNDVPVMELGVSAG